MYGRHGLIIIIIIIAIRGGGAGVKQKGRAFGGGASLSAWVRFGCFLASDAHAAPAATTAGAVRWHGDPGDLTRVPCALRKVAQRVGEGCGVLS